MMLPSWDPSCLSPSSEGGLRSSSSEREIAEVTKESVAVEARTNVVESAVTLSKDAGGASPAAAPSSPAKGDSTMDDLKRRLAAVSRGDKAAKKAASPPQPPPVPVPVASPNASLVNDTSIAALRARLAAA